MRLGNRQNECQESAGSVGVPGDLLHLLHIANGGYENRIYFIKVAVGATSTAACHSYNRTCGCRFEGEMFQRMEIIL